MQLYYNYLGKQILDTLKQIICTFAHCCFSFSFVLMVYKSNLLAIFAFSNLFISFKHKERLFQLSPKGKMYFSTEIKLLEKYRHSDLHTSSATMKTSKFFVVNA